MSNVVSVKVVEDEEFDDSYFGAIICEMNIANASSTHFTGILSTIVYLLAAADLPNKFKNAINDKVESCLFHVKPDYDKSKEIVLTDLTQNVLFSNHDYGFSDEYVTISIKEAMALVELSSLSNTHKNELNLRIQSLLYSTPYDFKRDFVV